MNARPSARTLKNTVLRALAKSFIVCALVGAGAQIAGVDDNDIIDMGQGETQTDVVPSEADRLIEKHDCVEVAAGAYPEHAVVTDSEGRTRYVGRVGTGHAFEQLVFHGVLRANEFTKPVDHGMIVHTTC